MGCKHNWHLWEVRTGTSGFFNLDIKRMAFFICDKCGECKTKEIFKQFAKNKENGK